MSIDLSKLSAKELFELAQQKEKQELDAAEKQAKLNELMAKRESMLAEHKGVLQLTDKKIRDMQEQREKLIADHAKAVAELDKEIAAHGGKANTPSASTTVAGNGDRLKATIRQIMNKRAYISASLLKEKLEGYGIKPANFNQELDKWVRDGWFVNKGKGNYALGNKV